MNRSAVARAEQTTPTAAELVRLACDLADHPESRLRRSTLNDAVREAMETAGDAPLFEAIDAAPHLRVARLIGAAAESTSETADLSDQGTRRRTTLFTVSIVARFKTTITTHEFEDEFGRANRFASLLARWRECRARRSVCHVLPQAFLFEELTALSFAQIYSVARLASTAQPDALVRALRPSSVAAARQRRSATFVRYLVGYRHGDERTSHDNATDVGRFCEAVRAIMRTTMPDAVEVTAHSTGRFHQPIWHGLGAYQHHRIAEVVHALAAQGLAASALGARLTLVANRRRCHVQLGFLRGGQPLSHQAYTLPVRPLDEPTSAVERIAAQLQALGVRTISQLSRADRASPRTQATFLLPL